jgi:hypothetical protein
LQLPDALPVLYGHLPLLLSPSSHRCAPRTAVTLGTEHCLEVSQAVQMPWVRLLSGRRLVPAVAGRLAGDIACGAGAMTTVAADE